MEGRDGGFLFQEGEGVTANPVHIHAELPEQCILQEVPRQILEWTINEVEQLSRQQFGFRKGGFTVDIILFHYRGLKWKQ